MRTVFTSILLCAVASFAPAVAAAEPPGDWSGVTLATNAGSNQATVTFAPYDIQVNQLAGINIPGRGIVFVPATTQRIPVTSVTTSGTGGGLQLGYSRQRGHFLWGLDAGVTGGGRGTSTETFTLLPTALQVGGNFGISRSAAVTSSIALTPRLGIASKRNLIYALGGPTWTNVTITASESLVANPAAAVLLDHLGAVATCPSDSCPGNFPANPYFGSAAERHAHHGTAYGFGVEHRMSSTTAIGIEYRHASLGTRDYTVGATTITELCAAPLTFPVTSPPTASACGPGNSTGSLGANPVSVSLTTINLTLNFKLR